MWGAGSERLTTTERPPEKSASASLGSRRVKAPVVADKYMLLRKLGAGGMAEVFLAKQASEGNFEKLVVIKRILPHLATGPANSDFVAMFLDEARLAAELRHPNIVNVVDVGKAAD